MPRYDDDRLRAIFERANGCCHLCGKKLALSNYGAHGRRGAWEVDHSRPLADGGTDHLNNLYPAHTSCNRSKQAQSSTAVRKTNGRTRPPLSSAALEREKETNALTGAFAGGLLGARIAGPHGFLIGAIVGGLASSFVEPDA
jgi:5-methylcytosine-specific restriction endonuclease McrA